jgi:hypothetical protein
MFFVKIEAEQNKSLLESLGFSFLRDVTDKSRNARRYHLFVPRLKVGDAERSGL